MRNGTLAWLWLTAGVALGCSSNTSYDRKDETGGSAGASATGGGSAETGGAETDTGGGPAGGTTGGNPTGGADSGGSGGSDGGTTASGGATAGGAETGGSETGGAETGGADVGGAAGHGGVVTGGTSTGGVISGGASGGGAETGGASTGGLEAGGAGGEGGSGTEGTTVQGTVIDFWGHPIPNVPVDIGGTLASTDADGQFTIADVPDHYDVTLAVQYLNGGTTNVWAWAYLGLTRRDPTLQIYSGLDLQSGSYTVSQTGGVFDSSPNWALAFGGPDGAGHRDGIGENGVITSTSWRGPASTTETAHSLLWEMDGDDLPLTYLAYDSQNVALSETEPASFVVDLSGDPLDAATLAGSVTPGVVSDRTNGVFVRFGSGASIPVVEDYAGPDNFSYVVPVLADVADASISVAASEGSTYPPPYAVAHVDGLTATSTPSLVIPTPATPQIPADGATDVDVGTQFAFAAAPGVGGHVVMIEDNEYYQGLFVVTDTSPFTLPEVPGFQLRADGVHVWSIETHGEFASVDEMVGPEGFLDAYSMSPGVPRGTRSGDGSYTMAAWRAFTTAP